MTFRLLNLTQNKKYVVTLFMARLYRRQNYQISFQDKYHHYSLNLESNLA